MSLPCLWVTQVDSNSTSKTSRKARDRAVERAKARTKRLGYSPLEAAVALGVSRGYVYKLLASGELRSFTLGRRRIIPAEDVTALVQTAVAGIASNGGEK